MASNAKKCVPDVEIDTEPLVRLPRVRPPQGRRRGAEMSREELWQMKNENEKFRRALIEVDTYLAALNWWHVGNLAKAGEVLGDAIGWDTVRQINEQYAPKCCSPKVLSSDGYAVTALPRGDHA